MVLWRRGRSWYHDFWCKRQRYTGCFGPVAATTAKHLYTKAKAQALDGALGVSPKVKADPRKPGCWLHVGPHLEMS
jgi:hypothetical protein